MSSNVGGYNRAQHASVGAADTMGGRSSGSRRQAVLERNKLNAGGASGQDNDSRRGGPSMERQTSQNYGLFLGGSGGGTSVPPRPERSKTQAPESRAPLGDQGNTIISNDSGTAAG